MNIARPVRRALATNSSASGFTAANLAPTGTEPAPDGVVHLVKPRQGGPHPRYVKLWAIGVGSENDAFSVRVIGWNRVIAGDDLDILWLPEIAFEIAVILGTKVGVAGTPVLATERFADTYTLVASRQSFRHGLDDAVVVTRGRVYTFNPTGDFIGYAVVPTDGYDRLTFDFDQTTGTPTMNVLYQLLDGVA